MHRLGISTFVAALLLALSASTALAVPLHQHYIVTPSGEAAAIAQGICMNDLQTAVDQLHANVHFGAPTEAFATNPVGFSAGACP